VGYPHYWYTKRDTPPEQLIEASRKMVPIVRKGEGILAGWDGEGEPEADANERVWFNGRQDKDEDCETFAWPPDLSARLPDHPEDESFYFCKTAGMPYDPYVLACLLAAKSVLGSRLRLLSDGGPEAFSDPSVVDIYVRALDENPPPVAETGDEPTPGGV
jgi:hypothetical protein